MEPRPRINSGSTPIEPTEDVRSGASGALPCAGTFAGFWTKGGGEVGLVGEADVDGDLGERTVSLQEQLLGLGDSRLQQPLVRREPGRDLESPAEVGPRQLHQVGQDLQRDVLSEMRGQ